MCCCSYFSGDDIARAVLEALFVIWLLFHIGMFTKIVFNEIRQGRSVLKWLHTPWWNFIFLLSLCVCHLFRLLLKAQNPSHLCFSVLQFYVVSVIWFIVVMQRSNSFVSGIKNVADTKDFAVMEAISKEVTSWTYFSAVCLLFVPPSVYTFLTIT